MSIDDSVFCEHFGRVGRPLRQDVDLFGDSEICHYCWNCVDLQACKEIYRSSSMLTMHFHEVGTHKREIKKRRGSN